MNRTKTQDKNVSILRTEKAFEVKKKHCFIIFKEISVAKNRLRAHLSTFHNRKEELFSKRANLLYAKFFTEYLLTTKMKETQILMNKPVYLGLSILELSKMLIHEF